MKLKRDDLHITIERQARPKGRTPIWTLCMEAQEQVIFDQAWLSISLLNQDAAQWLSEQVVEAIMKGTYASPPGHSSFVDHVITCEPRVAIQWHELDSSGDDLNATCQHLILRIEHMDGPLRGGTWWARLSENQRLIWDSHDASSHRLRIKSRKSAQWLLELLAHNALAE